MRGAIPPLPRMYKSPGILGGGCWRREGPSWRTVVRFGGSVAQGHVHTFVLVFHLRLLLPEISQLLGNTVLGAQQRAYNPGKLSYSTRLVNH
jgi:hypothetical protein